MSNALAMLGPLFEVAKPGPAGDAVVDDEEVAASGLGRHGERPPTGEGTELIHSGKPPDGVVRRLAVDADITFRLAAIAVALGMQPDEFGVSRFPSKPLGTNAQVREGGPKRREQGEGDVIEDAGHDSSQYNQSSEPRV